VFRSIEDVGNIETAELGWLLSNGEFRRGLRTILAPRVGVSERGLVGSGYLGVDAGGEGAAQPTPACYRLTGGHRDFSLTLPLREEPAKNKNSNADGISGRRRTPLHKEPGSFCSRCGLNQPTDAHRDRRGHHHQIRRHRVLAGPSPRSH